MDLNYKIYTIKDTILMWNWLKNLFTPMEVKLEHIVSHFQGVIDDLEVFAANKHKQVDTKSDLVDKLNTEIITHLDDATKALSIRTNLSKLMS